VKLEVNANTAKASVRAALFLHEMTIRTKTERNSSCNAEDAATAYDYLLSWTWYGNAAFCVAILQWFSLIS
jgi:hypothetical protein